MKSLSCVRLFATPWTVAYKDPQSMGFSRQEYWSGLAAISFSRGSSQPRDRTWVSHIVGKCFYHLSHQGSLQDSISLQDNIRENLDDLEQGDSFLEIMPKAGSMKERTDRLNFTNIFKNFAKPIQYCKVISL